MVYQSFTCSFTEHSSAINNGASSNPPGISQQFNLPKTNLVSFSHSLSVRLDEFNYLPWKYQVLAAIKGSRLQRFLEPNQALLQFITVEDQTANTVNPEYEDWEQQDNILVSWLLSSMSEKVLTRMVGSDSAAQIWINLCEYYTSLNRAKIGQYKTLLRNTKMQASLNDYLLKIKSVIDTLASIGHPTSAHDHIEAIFNGLPTEYNVFITSVNTRTDPYSVAEIEALPQCQLCHKLKHTVQQCFYGFDKSFTGPESFQNIQGNHSANIVEIQAYYATHEIVNDLDWYPDSGATNHLTPNELNLNTSNTYLGEQQVHWAMEQLENGLYKFDSHQLNLLNSHNKQPSPSPPSSSKTPVAFTHCNSSSLSDVHDSFPLWHKRLGHPHYRTVQHVLTASNIKTSNKNNDFSKLCSACCLGKHHKLPFPTSTTVYTTPLQLLHSDLWGPAPINSASGYRYYINFVDAFSRHTWIYMLRTKNGALNTFITFKTQVELQLGLPIKQIQSDWGGEYQAFTQFLQQSGIVHKVSCPHMNKMEWLNESIGT
uniref:Integrase catalytic domain-containing protein n=1 Tax=Cannabis sativa TaxID=3483 RepID=A0A803QJK9_CANSA